MHTLCTCIFTVYAPGSVALQLYSANYIVYETKVTRLYMKMAAGADQGCRSWWNRRNWSPFGEVPSETQGYKAEKVTVLGRRKVEVCKGNNT